MAGESGINAPFPMAPPGRTRRFVQTRTRAEHLKDFEGNKDLLYGDEVLDGPATVALEDGFDPGKKGEPYK